VPDLKQLIAKDSKAKPADKYAVLSDVLDWATNVGYPGYSTPAIAECWQTWVLNTMFAEAATGAETPESALARADNKMKAIWAKWKEGKMIWTSFSSDHGPAGPLASAACADAFSWIRSSLPAKVPSSWQPSKHDA